MDVDLGLEGERKVDVVEIEQGLKRPVKEKSGLVETKIASSHQHRMERTQMRLSNPRKLSGALLACQSRDGF